MFGTIGTLVMGCGLSLVMALVNDSICNAMLSGCRKKFADQIIALRETLPEQ